MPRAPRSTVDYGLDLSCGFEVVTLDYPDGDERTERLVDFTENLDEVSGRTCLSQAMVRRLITPRGALLGDPEYGSDVTRYMNDDIDDRDVGAILAELDAELVKDERVMLSSSTGVLDEEGALVTETRVTDGDGAFTLTLKITDVTVKLLGVS